MVVYLSWQIATANYMQSVGFFLGNYVVERSVEYVAYFPWQ